MRQTLQLLSRQRRCSAAQTHLIATHEQSISRLDLFETVTNQRLAWLEQRLDLIEHSTDALRASAPRRRLVGHL
jgi:hypothetical protein